MSSPELVSVVLSKWFVSEISNKNVCILRLKRVSPSNIVAQTDSGTLLHSLPH